MVVRFRCPNPQCGKRYKVDESLVGHSTVCKACGREFTISASGEGTLPPDGLAETLRPDDSGRATGGDVPGKLGRFEIRARIGSGAFGTVYWAHDPVLDREVALKVPRAAVLEKPQARARFLREPKAAAQLRHPNIVPVYDAGSDGEHYYIASAYIEGRTLEQVITHDRPDFRRAAEITRDLAGALHYAHRVGVVHRDIKPANIMIDRHGQALLMDFGLARLESSEEKLTQDGSIMGTPAYMAPEQADGSLGEVGPASDQYGLGVVLYELLCGDTPFSGTPAVVIFNVIHQEPMRPRSRRREIAGDLETICLKAMAKRPADRYAHCGMMAEDLRRWLEGEPIHARRMGPVERVGRWCRRNPAIAAALGTVVVVTLAALVAVTSAWRVAQANRELAETRLGGLQAEQRKTQIALDDANVQRAFAEEKRAEAEKARIELQAALDREREALGELEDSKKELEDSKKQLEDNVNELQAEIEKRKAAEQGKDIALGEKGKEKYANDIALARERWLAGDYALAEQILDSCPPELRQWEWRYLKRRVRGYFWKDPSFAGGAPCLFSPDGLKVACVVGDAVKLWEVATAQCLSTIPLREGASSGSDALSGAAITFRADGALIAVGGTLLGQEEPWRSVPTPQGMITVGGRQKAIRIVLLDVTTGKKLLDWEDPFVSVVRGVSFSPNGELIACAGAVEGVANASPPKPTILKLWDAKNGEVVGFVPAPRSGELVRSYDWLWDGASGQVIIACGEYGNWVVDPDSRQVVGTKIASSRSVTPPCFSPDGRLRVVEEPSRGGRRLSVYDVTADQRVLEVGPQLAFAGLSDRDQIPIRRFPQAAVPPTAPEGLSPDGQQIARASEWTTDPLRYAGAVLAQSGTALTVWDCLAGQATFTLRGHTAGVYGLAISSDGNTIVSGGMDKTVRVWDGRSRRNLLTFVGHSREVTCVAVSPDDTRIASGSGDETVKIWDPTNGKESWTLAASGGIVSDLSFNADGTRLASASGEKIVQVWDVTAGKELSAWRKTGGPRVVSFSPDGTLIAVGGRDKVVKLVDPQTGNDLRTLPAPDVIETARQNALSRAGNVPDDYRRQLEDKSAALPGHKSDVTDLAFSPDGRWLASASRDRTIIIWDMESEEEVRTLEGHSAEVMSVAFSPDGTRIASGSLDKTVRVWDTETGREIIRLEDHKSGVNAVAFDSPGRRILSAGSDYMVKIWDGTLVGPPEPSTASPPVPPGMPGWIAPDGTSFGQGSDIAPPNAVPGWIAPDGTFTPMPYGALPSPKGSVPVPERPSTDRTPAGPFPMMAPYPKAPVPKPDTEGGP